MPARAFAEIQPETAIVDALRNLLTGHPVGTGIGAASAWCTGILVVAYTAATAVYRRRVAGEPAEGRDGCGQDCRHADDRSTGGVRRCHRARRAPLPPDRAAAR